MEVTLLKLLLHVIKYAQSKYNGVMCDADIYAHMPF